MEKMEYQCPRMDVVEMALVEMIATSLRVDESGTAGSDIVAGHARSRRGSWGDLWEQMPLQKK